MDTSLIKHNGQTDGRFFWGPWMKFGAFEKAMDFLGNGSLWVLEAPGYMLGNLCAIFHVGEDR